ncbi:protein-methionine sulfoxide oxidase mical3a isoform X1 [Acanthochromis polyacanthus]|uniref:protein-methionine sulfoxide oxidase mical3a isoform X1 n=1 Tax=Acanthochromis polyacanthus TaxID=80966 RepID=UPI002234ACCA|nr:protein-methionine sulfoxide oxidase mical3a isoform X1 [Acanthochromis polyacanthus]XP_051807357.1 protein-methionine sulfoxide oxidase mical3a isoform X1 [Acanthochromis polyacanthus]XP_051807358.1 protein-methionine sulfoxide oxidase mical3a isoform X1 [Acanthochromis polyacanthus]
MGDGGAGAAGGDGVNLSHVLFDNFVQATTCKGTLKAFQELCDHLEVKPNEYRVFYHKLKSKLNYWKAKALWAKLDKRASHKEYKKGRACANSKCLIIGAGPCGLRTAIELAFLGAKVVLLEKRDAFSRNNVLHLWPFTIQDLRGLGAKKFYGKFCAGAIDHISIRQLQLMLLKVALLVGIEIHVNVEFKGLIEPPEDQETERIGWRAEVHPRTHPVNELEFDVIIGADGRRNTLPGFRRKEFRGKLAIAITANFINRNTTAEAKVEEISGVAFIFNQKFFQDLREATGIDLENIVYYKDDTHYFVMTAKKQSLLEKGVILHDYADTELLLSRANVDQAALLSYAREAADFSTNHQLPTLDFAINHYGQPDVAMFDFTCMYASENAAMVRQRSGHKLLVALVGDSLLEPFWPMGTGIARGFLAAMDSGWMVKSWAQGKTPLEVLAERESIYRLLPQTTPENVSKNFSQYSVDPTTRYPNISLNFLKPSQVRHLFDTGECREIRIEIENVINSSTPKLARNDNYLLDKQLQESIARSSKLLNWCQRQTDGYRNVNVTDLTMSWKSGLALCALIHRYRPDLIDFDSLDERDQEKNNQLGFDVAEREFGISPCMTGKEMSSVVEPDKLSMVMYLSQFYEMFKDTVPPGDNHNLSPEEKAALIASTKSPISFLSKLGQSIAISRKRNPKDKKEKDVDGLGKRRKTSQSEDEEVSRSGRDDRPSVPAVLTERKMDSAAVGNNNKVKVMATQLLAKFEENAPAQPTGLKRQGESLPNLDRLLPLTPPQTPVKEPVRLAPVPAWRKARSGADPLSSSGARSCPKKTILLPTSSSTSSLSLHSEGSLRKEFPVNIGGSDVCFFCRKRVYVMERLSAEGKFFHRSCFKCDYCGTTLRLSSYAFDVEDGKFYCKPHYCYRLSGYAQRKRPAPSPAPITAKENQTAQTPSVTVDAPGRAMAAAAPSAELQPSVPEVNGLQEPSLAKRLRGTPERIELENYRLSLQREEELEEVPEETLAEHNLSSVLDKVTDADLGSSSSESDMEEEDEQEDQEEVELEEHLRSPSDLGGVPWKEAVELHAKLRGEEGDDEAQADDVSRDGELDEEEEEDEEEEDEEEEEESSDEGDYCPWDRELQSGLWLEKYLTDEEDVGTFKARNLQIQQVLQPVDPNAIPGLVRPHLDSEGDKDGQLASASQLSQPSELTQPSSTEPCEDEELEAEADSPDIEPGTEMDQDDIPSDAEAEARLHQSENNEAPHEEDKESDSLGMASSIEPSCISPVQKEDIVLSPIQPSPEPETQITPVKSPGTRFFTDPFIPEETKPEKTTPSPVARSPISPSAAPVQIPPSVPSPTLAATSPVSIPASPLPASPLLASPLPASPLPASPLPASPLPASPLPASPLPASPLLASPLPASPLPASPLLASPLLASPLPASPLLASPLLASPLPASPLPASPLLASPLPASPVKSPVVSPVQPANESARSPIKSPVSSPIRSQPTPLPETRAPKSPVYPHRSICPLTGNPLSPICAQPLPCHEPSSPLTSDSPVRTQPVPAVTSTPMTKTDKTTPEASKSEDSSTEETPSKKTDIIEEFWLKSAEIRKSLGLSPLDRSSKLLEKSIVKAPPQESAPAKTQTPDVSEEPKPAFTGRSVIRRINITLEGQVITPLAPAEAKSDGSDKRDISSSSGLGLNGSMATSQTVNSDSYNTSDSTMLTPPSSPPPPVPANQSPAVLRQQRHQVSWSNGPEKPPPERAKEPAKTKTPVPAPRTQLSPVSAPKPAPRKVSSPQATPETTPVVVMREKKKPRPEEVRKSFVETVEEIPFADDVEETYDERTPETSMNRFYTPPSSKPSREKPPLHLALAMENGKPNIPANPVAKTQRATQFSPEAKEIAEERIRAREKSVKSQVLKDAMAKQLNKMKESDTDKGASPKVAWSVTPDAPGKNKKSAGSPKTSAVKALESKKGETLPERFFSSNKSLDSSVASSDGSSASKSKKRSSLFSPRKNKKEKKAKNDSSKISGADETPPKHKSLWKAVFSGYKKDKKKKDDKSCPSTPSSSSTTQDSAKKRTSPLGRSSDLKSRRNLSFSEDSDLSCDDVLERSSQKSKADSVYVPHALAFKRSYATKKTYTEEELNAKLTRRVQKAARRQAKQEELKRLHRAQIIQRQLEQVEEKQRQLEERGVAVEKALRGEAGLYKGTYTLPKQHKRRSDYWGDSNYSEILDLHLGGMGKKDDPKLMQEWFKLVQEKNALVRYESELMIFARELELEDRQSRLQQELRERMAVEDHLKTEKELAQEKQILNEMLEVVEQRDALVALLDEQRLREKEEDKDLEAVMLSKGFNLNWA